MSETIEGWRGWPAVWAGLAGFAVPFVVMAALYNMSWGKERDRRLAAEQAGEALTAQVADIERRLQAIQAKGCVFIDTPVVHVSVYDTPNLGTKPTRGKPQ